MSTADWLKDNYSDNNGLPLFFIVGDYSYIQKDTAEKDYKETVNLAKESSDREYSNWAQAVIASDFSVLANTSIKEFWAGLLDHENRQNSLNSYQKYKFIHSYSSSEKYTQTKRKQTRDHPSQPPRPRVVVDEIDGVYLQGLDSSVGSFIKTLANNSRIINRKSKYFATLGMNSILDTTDETEGSQLSHLTEEAKEACKERFRSSQPTVELETANKYEEFLFKNEKNYNMFLKKSLDRIIYSCIPDDNYIVRDIYQHILKLHMFSPEMFTTKGRNFLSEQDYVIKCWGYLIETIFRSSGVMAHWGDTISSFSMELGMHPRMDLRLINLSVEDLKEALDIGNAEFSRAETETKYYKDLLKLVISSKIHLNELVKDFPGLTSEKIKNVKMPLCVVAGTQFYVYSLSLVSKHLYVIQDVCDMSIPSSLKELKEDGILNLMKSLLLFKDTCLVVKEVADQRADIINANKIPKIGKNKKTPAASLNWCTNVWTLSSLEDNDDE
ncbi:hypothetical protein BD770DRAFT_387377 [Pilaira anomala]|nr:hypothetical protein BD770DRAFT_387377 [Pilaira anomala]